MARIHPRLVALVGALAPIVGVLAPRGFAATLAVAALLIAGVYRKEEGHWSSLPWIPAVLLGLLLGWGALSAFWNFSPAETLGTTAKLAALSVGGMIFIAVAAGLTDPERGRVRQAFGIGFAVSVVLLAGEEWTGGLLTQTLRNVTGQLPFDDLAFLNMTACVSAMMVWPAVIACSGWRRRFLLAVPIGAVALLLGPLDSLAAQVAVAAGAVVFVAALCRERVVFRGLRIAVFGLMVFAPVLPHLLPTPAAAFGAMPNLSSSVVHRISIWQFAAARIVEKPLTGWGLESSRHFQERYGEAFPGKFRAADINHRVEAALAYFKSQVLPLHPHNGFLQVWLELGAVGALAFMALLLWVLAGAERLAASPCGRAGAAALFASGLVVFLTAFGAWQSWWQAALWLIAGLAVAMGGQERDGGKAGVR